MIIESVRLNNIKSYVDETINLSEGINCILGLNGSGKSTIIEAIGYALFNFNRYTPNNKIVRYNEKKGIVEVVFVGEDARRYKVIRTQRNQSSTAVLMDVENNTILYEGIENVYAFIKKILNISNTKEFSRMFEEIIAVPQGSYVSAFLTTSSERKENFDKLFELHIYRNIANKLKDLLDFIKENYIIKLDKEITELSARLLPYQERKKQKNILEVEIKNLENKLIKEKKELEKTKNKKQELESLKKRLEEVKTQKALNEESTKHIKNFLEKKRLDLKSSQEADEILKKTKVNYLQYLNNNEKIIRLEKEYESLQEKEKALQNLEKNIEILNEKSKHINNNLDEITKKIKETKVNFEDHKGKGVLLQTELIKLEEEIVKEEIILSEITKKTKEEKQIINNLEQNIRFFEAQKNSLDSQELRSTAELKKIIKELEEKSLQNDELIKKHNDLLLQKNCLQSAYITALNNASLAIDGMCPFLNSKCKNINEGSLEDYFNNQAEQIKQDETLIDEEVLKLKSQIEDPKNLIILREKYLKEQEEIIVKEKSINALKNEIIKTFSLDKEDSNLDLNILIAKINKINQEKQKNLIVDEEKLNLLLQAQVARKTKQSTQKFGLELLEKRTKEIENEVKLLQKNYDSLYGDLLKNTRKSEEAKSSHALLLQDLVNSQEVKTKLNNLKAENVKLEPEKDLYIANENTAKELLKIQKEIEENQAALQENDKKQITIEETLQNIQTVFSFKILEDTNNLFNQLLEEVSKLQTTIHEKQINLADVNKILLEMEELKLVREQLEAKRTKRNEQGEFIAQMRKIYTDLPMRLSQTYREYISLAATNLYREIAKENVRIELKEDYLVCLYDGNHLETYKTIEQLSGGEQMSVAIAIRLSMLRHIAGVNIYFLDEPTINLDSQRREKIAEVIKEAASNLSQLFVISHDDTFDEITQNIINIEKINNISKRV